MSEEQVIQLISTLDLDSLKRIKHFLNIKIDDLSSHTPPLLNTEIISHLWNHYQTMKPDGSEPPQYLTVGCYSLSYDQFVNYLQPIDDNFRKLYMLALKQKITWEKDRILSDLTRSAVKNSYNDLFQIWKNTTS